MEWTSRMICQVKEARPKGSYYVKEIRRKKPTYLISYISTYMKCLELENSCPQEIDYSGCLQWGPKGNEL